LVSSLIPKSEVTMSTLIDLGIDPAELLADKAAAKELRQKPSTLASWRATGRGPRYYKIGRSVFYAPADLREWLVAQRQTPRSRAERASAV
jgi:hypothetical protein